MNSGSPYCPVGLWRSESDRYKGGCSLRDRVLLCAPGSVMWPSLSLSDNTRLQGNRPNQTNQTDTSRPIDLQREPYDHAYCPYGTGSILQTLLYNANPKGSDKEDDECVRLKIGQEFEANSKPKNHSQKNLAFKIWSRIAKWSTRRNKITVHFVYKWCSQILLEKRANSSPLSIA